MKQEEIIKHAHLINERIGKYFKRLPRTRYNLVLVHDKFEDLHNFFIEIRRPNQFSRSIPLGTFELEKFSDLIECLKVIRSKWEIPLHFVNYSKLEMS